MQINRETVQFELAKLIRVLLTLTEVTEIRIADVHISKKTPTWENQLQRAVDQSYHDCYSDVDLQIAINTSKLDASMLNRYAKQWEHFGFEPASILGAEISQSNVCRIVLKNGMRYDMVFDFEQPETVAEGSPLPANTSWPIENINRFWFVQIQALGKLYRNDYLISLHLANSNLNETLVQQMILRDRKYGTTHHRYGYSEEIEYLRYHDQCPITTGLPTFDLIAQQLWHAALAYDELMRQFDPSYENRSGFYLKIWHCYEQNRLARM